MMSKLLTLATVALLTLCGMARAQESILPLPLEKTGAMAAVTKATREHRVLIVVHEWKRPSQGRRPWWANDTIRGWLKWHGMLVELDHSDPETKDYLKRFRPNDTTHTYGFDIIIDGKQREPLSKPPFGIPAAKSHEDWGETTGIGLTAVYVLFQIDFQLERMLISQPTWAIGHLNDCPEPKRPERAYRFNMPVDGITPIQDIESPAAGDRYVDVLARVKEADTLAAGGVSDRLKATALLTWAWERGGDLDPGFALARVGIVLPRLAALKKVQTEASKRMTELAEAELALYPWFDDSEELGYLALRYMNGETGKVFWRVLTENNDLDEETMGALVSARLGELKTNITELTTERVISEKTWRQLVPLTRLREPKASHDDSKKRWDRQKAEVLAVGAVRTYASLLASDDPAERERAASIAKDVIAASATSPPAVRASVLRALVFAAASVRQVGPVQAAWIDEAATLDPVDAKVKGGAADPLKKYIGTGR